MKAIIFDMDGTMIDNMMIHHRAWRQKLAEYGLHLSLEEVKEKVHGINVEVLERLFGDRFTPQERERISWEKEAAYREVYLPEIKLVDGLRDFLEACAEARLPMAIATASPPENVGFAMELLKLQPHFTVVLHAGDVQKGKPDPEIYLKAAARLGVAPEDCVVFEDSPVGALAASRAGCTVVVVTTTHVEAEFDGFAGVKGFVRDFTTLSPAAVAGLVRHNDLEI